MLKKFDHKQIEKKWQKYWESNKIYATAKKPKKKMYILDMFPYPSGAGLHVGHPEGYTATDIYSRYLRMNGYDVLHPMGWDAFGLPAENYAINAKIHPAKSTAANVKRFREQIKMLGLSYDWDREIDTSDPDYYKWTQWLFLKLYEKGLAYRKEANVNWCPKDQTVLANEQVVNGKCERCGTEVIQKKLPQWFFKITDYVDRLLADLDKIDWPEPIKIMQRNWIGRSEGAEISFPIVIPAKPALDRDRGAGIQSKVNRPGSRVPPKAGRQAGITEGVIKVFTTRPDTIFGATYIVLAPEHPLVENLKSQITNSKEVEEYIQKSKKKTELQRTALEKDKTGVELKGVKVINPATKAEIPVWIADYVLMGYGTGAIMAVPAHDERDFLFAIKYDLPIKQVIYDPHFDSPPHEGEKEEVVEVYHGEGKLFNSGKFSGMDSERAKWEITGFVKGTKKTQCKLRDWLISRQRYWGAPIPVIYCRKCREIPNPKSQIPKVAAIDNIEYAVIPVPEKGLPVKLPNDVDFKPTGQSPLARSKSFNKVKCPVCGNLARRETDTMDTFVDSSWYYIRYTDPKNKKAPFDRMKAKTWLPVDIYVGGAEHAVLHLLYSRFICKALADMGYLKFEEPFLKLRNQGLILSPDNQKMSKSRGNVINPDDVVDAVGADSLRIYEMFMGPLEDSKPWSTEGIKGVRRFLEKVWRIYTDVVARSEATKQSQSKKIAAPLVGLEARNDGSVETLLHKTIKKVTEDINAFKFNTAVSALMVLANEFSTSSNNIDKNHRETFLKILAPFAPHLAEELWHQLGHKSSIHLENWPKFDPELIKEGQVSIVIQVNGKHRGTISVAADATQEQVEKTARDDENVKKHLEGKEVKKVIYVPNKIINFVIG